MEILIPSQITPVEFKIEKLWDTETDEEVDCVNPGKAGQSIKMKLPIKCEKGWILRRKKWNFGACHQSAIWHFLGQAWLWHTCPRTRQLRWKRVSLNPTTKTDVYPESFPASLNPIIKHKTEAMPTKLKEIGLYSTNTLPSVKPIIE